MLTKKLLATRINTELHEVRRKLEIKLRDDMTFETGMFAEVLYSDIIQQLSTEGNSASINEVNQALLVLGGRHGKAVSEALKNVYRKYMDTRGLMSMYNYFGGENVLYNYERLDGVYCVEGLLHPNMSRIGTYDGYRELSGITDEAHTLRLTYKTELLALDKLYKDIIANVESCKTVKIAVEYLESIGLDRFTYDSEFGKNKILVQVDTTVLAYATELLSNKEQEVTDEQIKQDDEE